MSVDICLTTLQYLPEDSEPEISEKLGGLQIEEHAINTERKGLKQKNERGKAGEKEYKNNRNKGK
jgi:hypothetical protein